MNLVIPILASIDLFLCDGFQSQKTNLFPSRVLILLADSVSPCRGRKAQARHRCRQREVSQLQQFLEKFFV